MIRRLLSPPRFKDQAETVDDLASFKLHCEERQWLVFMGAK